MKHRLFSHINFVFILLIISSCGLNKSSSQSYSYEFKKSLLDEEIRRSNNIEFDSNEANAHFHFLVAELELNNSNFKTALDNLKIAADLEKSDSISLRKRLAQVLIRDGKLDEALQELDKIDISKSNDESILNLKAGIYASQKNNAKAIEIYQQIIETQKEFSEEPYILLASILTRDSNYKEAKKVLNRLLKKENDSLFGNYYLAKLSEVTGETKSAKRYYEKSLALAPNAENILIDYVKFISSTSGNDKAISYLKNLIKKEANNRKARDLLGQILVQENRLEEAVGEMQSMSEVSGSSNETRFNVALLRIQNKQFEKAMDDLSLILANDPSNSKARYYLATCFVGLKKTDEAVSEFTKINKDQELYVESRTFSAYVLSESGKLKEAIEFVESALDVKKDDIKLLIFLANLQKEDGQIQNAIKSMSKVIEAKPKSDGNLFTLAVLYDDNKQRDKAIETLKKVIELNPNNSSALNYLGYTYVEENIKLEEARGYINKALEIEKDNAYYLDSLGWLEFKLGNYSKAKEIIKKALSFEQTDPVLFEHLAEVDFSLGNYEDAKSSVGKALEIINNRKEREDKETRVRLEKLKKKIEKKI